MEQLVRLGIAMTVFIRIRDWLPYLSAITVHHSILETFRKVVVVVL
jgi:hypothetical protein